MLPSLSSVIVDEIYVHRYTIDEAKDGYSDTPLAAPISSGPGKWPAHYTLHDLRANPG